jgi:hypothetical protein
MVGISSMKADSAVVFLSRAERRSSAPQVAMGGILLAKGFRGATVFPLGLAGA